PGGTYWTQWREYIEEQLLKKDMISPDDMNLFKITDDIDVAVREVLHFYKRYHSSRMVRDDLVMRLKSPLSPQAVERLNDEFGDLATGGRIHTLSTPMTAEDDEFPDLQRLVIKYNYRSIGRLRRMIDAINDEE
ncbi:MAG: cytochrome D ubiquinol oxidase subunit II, partial [Planctomycetes bacterium]|nr:cytochrome D ubiquinol oxidase subunit II [Planctomycetota bacterium]